MHAVPLTLGVLLGGCSALSPANLFHKTEGGVIAQPHAPPPGMNEPYPNLATVPPNPPPPDMAALEHISQGLIADRANARHLAEAAPLADPSSPSASPDLFGVGSATPPAPPGPAAATASLPAATAAPAPPSTPATPVATASSPGRPTAVAPSVRKAPVGDVQTAALPAAAAATPLPEMPETPPPPPPNVSVVATPAPAPQPGPHPAPNPSPLGPVRTPAVAPPAAVAMAHPPIAPVRPSAPPVPPATAPAAVNPANTVEVTFAPQSSSIPPASLSALKALAAKRGNHVIEALGRGDAASADPTAQEQAVTLGFARAQAIAAALAASGVPRGAIQVMSLASGSGGMAQLVE